MNVKDQIEVSFTEDDLIGRGQFGKVYKATGVDGTQYAAKVFPPHCQWNMAVELMHLTGLSHHPHPRILSFYGTGKRTNPSVQGEVVLLMELLPSSLQQELQKTKQPFEEDRALEIVRQVLEGLAHLHKLQMLHRDIKPDNILLTADGDVKLADFGTSTVRARPRSIRGTLAYMAPEVVKPEDYTNKVDVYSVGIVLVHLLHGSVVHVGEGGYELKGEQLQFGKKHGTLSLSLPDPEALKQTTQDLMSSMIRMDPAERPAAETLLDHAAFAHRRAQPRAAADLSPTTPHSRASTVAGSASSDDNLDHAGTAVRGEDGGGGGGCGVELLAQRGGARDGHCGAQLRPGAGVTRADAAAACRADREAEAAAEEEYVGLNVGKVTVKAADAKRPRVSWKAVLLISGVLLVLCLAAGVWRWDSDILRPSKRHSSDPTKASTGGVLRAAKWDEVAQQVGSSTSKSGRGADGDASRYSSGAEVHGASDTVPLAAADSL
mmetsp:Transcript_20029/g.47733  ORF Transcript_20029/g.47733 Transcript_20029/m.47733 type:complete len:491 (+) Transcript_20029:105-1577(+)